MNQIQKQRRRVLKPLVDVDFTKLSEDELSEIRAGLGIDLDRIESEEEIYRVKLSQGAVRHYFANRRDAYNFLGISNKQFKSLVDAGSRYNNYAIELGHWDAGLVRSGLEV